MKYLQSADLLLPDFTRVDGSRWAVIACDQFTSEPDYWKEVSDYVGDAPSTLSLILPELYLGERAQRLPRINAAMEEYCNSVLHAHKDSMIYLERTTSDGRVRHGIVGRIDLDSYDYAVGSTPLIRATEGTVLERIPPRVEIRRDAAIELPHVMLLIDDRRRSVIEPLAEKKDALAVAYDFPLMLGGGHVRGYYLDRAEIARINEALGALLSPASKRDMYGTDALPDLLFAVGDGNHSLAAAKAHYEAIKAQLGAEAAAEHPARYALVEVVNICDDALDFEPIYRVVFGADPRALLGALRDYAAKVATEGKAGAQSVLAVTADGEERIDFAHGMHSLTVGTLQLFLDRYLREHPDVTVDYIHGEDSLRSLACRPGAVGFLFDGMRKEELFGAVMRDGALPRKTFSMGEARDKRYYLECRRLK